VPEQEDRVSVTGRSTEDPQDKQARRPNHPHLALRTSLTRLSLRPRSIALLIAVPMVAVAAGLVGTLLDWRLGVDSAVYRAGALTLLHGDPLYDSNTLAPEPWWALLPFTYPPVAAVFFIPLALLPIQLAWGVLAAVSILAMALVIRIAIGTLPTTETGRWWATPARATLIFSVVLLGIEPVWRTLFLGQINLILMALIMLDILVISARGSRWGGVLVGVAAAVKLTPLVFVGHLFFTGRKADAGRALGTFLALQGSMFLLIPHDAVKYWTYTLFNTGRIGPIYWAGNQSLNGLLNRISGLASWATPLSYVLAVLLVGPAIWLMLRFHRRGQALSALLVTAFFVLLVSPVSWSHHWVWAVPLIVLLVSRLPETTPGRAWRRWLGLAAVLAVFVSCVLLALPNGRSLEMHWAFWQYVLGSAYMLVPAVLLLVLGWRWWRQRREARALR
jgi:alpha-1,2-mannosyltransferase